MRWNRLGTWIWRHATLLVGLIGLALTGVAWLIITEVSRSAMDRAFEQEVAQVADAIQTRFREVRHTLRAAHVLFGASDQVTAEEWRTLGHRLDLDDARWGIKGLAYVQRVPAADREAFVAAVRRDQPGFTLRIPEPRDVHHIIRFIAPAGANRPALGFDVASQPRSRAAQQRSLRTGGPALSEPMQLIQSPQGQPGLVMYCPVFDLDRPLDTLAQRQAALRGWVAASMDIDTLLGDLIGDQRWEVAPRVYDGPTPAPGRRMYQSAGFEPDAPRIGTRRIELAGRTWTLQCAALPGFGAEVRGRKAVVLAGGVLGTGMIGLIVFVLTGLRDRAEALAGRMTAELRRSEKRFRTAFESAAVGMVCLDMTGRFLDANEAFARMVGYSIDELRAMHSRQLDHPDDDRADRRRVADLVAGRCAWFSAEKRYQHRTGRPIWAIVTVTLIRGEEDAPDYLLAQVQDITERKRMEEELRHAALHDNLTGLPDRGVFEQRLKSAWRQRDAPDARPFAVLFMDLDRFKQVNDQIGHDAGNRLLCQIADRLRQCTRATDLISARAEAMPARVGGDEFTLLLEHLEDAEAAVSVARRVQQALNEPYDLGAGDHGDVSVSVGVATSEGPYEMPEEMVHAADRAMYRAKQNGRGRWIVLADEQRGIPTAEDEPYAPADEPKPLLAGPAF